MNDAIDDAIAAVDERVDFSAHHTIPLTITCSGRPAVLILPADLTDEEAIELAATILLQARAATRTSSPLVVARSIPT